jgi:chromosome segregation ATPase
MTRKQFREQIQSKDAEILRLKGEVERLKKTASSSYDLAESYKKQMDELCAVKYCCDSHINEENIANLVSERNALRGELKTRREADSFAATAFVALNEKMNLATKIIEKMHKGETILDSDIDKLLGIPSDYEKSVSDAKADAEDWRKSETRMTLLEYLVSKGWRNEKV